MFLQPNQTLPKTSNATTVPLSWVCFCMSFGRCNNDNWLRKKTHSPVGWRKCCGTQLSTVLQTYKGSSAQIRDTWQKVKPCVNSAQQEIRDWVTASFLWQIVYRKNWRQIPVKQSCTICVPSQRSCHAVNLTFQDPGPTSNLPKLSHIMIAGVFLSFPLPFLEIGTRASNL